MKKRPAKFSVKAYLASLQKPIPIGDKKALQARAAAIVRRAIKKARQKRSDPLSQAAAAKEQRDLIAGFVQRPSEAVLRARAATTTVHIIADLQKRTRRSKG